MPVKISSKSLRNIQHAFNTQNQELLAKLQENRNKQKSRRNVKCLAILILVTIACLMPLISQAFSPSLAVAAIVSVVNIVLFLGVGYLAIQCAALFNVVAQTDELYDHLDGTGLLYEYAALVTAYGLSVPNRPLMRLDYLVAKADAEVYEKTHAEHVANDPSFPSGSPLLSSIEYLEGLKQFDAVKQSAQTAAV